MEKKKKNPQICNIFGIEEKSIFPCLVLFFSPPPHVAEHVVQALHSPTSQSTELDLKQNYDLVNQPFGQLAVLQSVWSVRWKFAQASPPFKASAIFFLQGRGGEHQKG